MPKARDQRTERRYMVVRDQHGRKYETQYDKVSGDITGQVYPKGWTAPIIPHQKYMKTDPESPSQIIIDYEEWLGDIRERRREWMQAPEVLRLIGRPPQDEIFVRACKAHSRWALGKSQDVPPELVEFAASLIPAKPQEFTFSDADKPLSDSEEDDEYRELTDDEVREKADALRIQVEKRDKAKAEAERVRQQQMKLKRPVG